jgi:mannitol 2-dehydrogenase
MVKLNSHHLSLLPEQVRVPAFNRSVLKTGIVHIGTGNFYRGHLASYTDEILGDHEPVWGICGLGIREADSGMVDTLNKQDGLYTLMVREAGGELSVRVIGSLVENLFGPGNPLEALEKMADPGVRIVSLTITEGGYNFDSSTGKFILDAPEIQWDLRQPDDPRTVFGYLTQALKRRRDRGLPGVTVLSCDNMEHNGDTCRKMVMAYLEAADPGMIGWVERRVTFPNSMVDRITPATTPAEVEMLRTRFGFEDAWPVVCEPFVQWIIEDKFSNGRPPWESAGVQFVGDVAPYEKMKIRLLNAGHSLLGLLGSLLGYGTICEAVGDPMLEKILRRFMDQEVTPLLGALEGIDLTGYKESLIRRFANPYLKDPLSRICSESSAKIPKFLLPTIQEQLETGGSILIGTLVLAAWCHYSEKEGAPGYEYVVMDGMRDELRRGALESASVDVLAFVKIETVFGNLSRAPGFAETYERLLGSIRSNGIGPVVDQILKSNPQDEPF